MSDPWNKDHIPLPPEPRTPVREPAQSPPWRALGILFLLDLTASIVFGTASPGGIIAIFLAAIVGAVYVCFLTVLELFSLRFVAALVTLVVGALAVAIAGFCGAWAFAAFSFTGFW